MDFQNFLFTLPYMAKGLLGIFVVTIVLIGFITITNKLVSKYSNDEK